jgi:hypothetical protein
MATMSASDKAWNDYMSSGVYPGVNPDPYSVSPSSLSYVKPRDTSGAYGPVIQGTSGKFQKLPSSAGGGYVNVETGETVSGFSRPSTGSNVRYSGGGGGYSGGGGGGGGGAGAKPIEFFLGAAPTIPGLDLSGPMSQFRTAFNQINSGVNPSFNVDQNKLVSDAKSAAANLNMSPAQIKAMIAGVNPSTGEIVADVKAASEALNNPGEIAAKAGAIANSLNKKYQDEFESAMPGYKANMQAANSLTSTYLAGKIPQDVVDQVFRNSAAKGFTTGLLGGGIGRNIVARDLGLTSLQLQTAGANLLQQTANIANSVLASTMPVTGEALASRFITDPGQIFSTVSNMKRVDPTSIFNAVYVPTSQVYNQMSQMAQQSTLARANFEASKMVPPSMIFDALTSQAQYNQQINAANALNAWQSQPLPGQFDIKKGEYIGFTPGSTSKTAPTPPAMASLEVPGLKKPEPPKLSGGDYNTNAGRLAYYQRQLAAYNQARQAATAPGGGVAYIPQLTGFGAA